MRWASRSSAADTPRQSRGRARGRASSNWSRTHDGDTYRAVYTVRFADVVYVLHAFQKKSPSDIRTARADDELTARRLRIAQQDHEQRHDKRKR